VSEESHSAALTVLRRLLAGGEQAVPALEALARAVLALDEQVRPQTPEESNVFRREGDCWTIAYDGRIVRLRDSRGLACLAQLLGHPGHRFPASDLLAGSRRRAGHPPTPEHARLAVTKAIKGVLARLADSHPTLFSHLSATVRRGQVCCYTPDPRRSIRWVT